MAKKCQPGVICIENFTLIVILLILGYIIYQNLYVPISKKKEETVYNTTNVELPNIVRSSTHTVNAPVTINTQRMEIDYKQIGILTRVNNKETILPLYGRMVNTC